jgi:hypothetical protein
MPNGKIFVVLSGMKKGERTTEVYEINKKTWTLDNRIKL